MAGLRGDQRALFFPAPKMIEAPSFEGASLVSKTPPSGRHQGWGTWRVWVLAAGASRYTGSPFHDGGGPFLL